MTVACQGLGASVWYPCKDHQSDEPDNGATLQDKGSGFPDCCSEWKINVKEVQKLIRLCCLPGRSKIRSITIISFLISANMCILSDSYIGETGKPLTLDYWVLDYNLEKAKKQFERDVKLMLKCFEYWFGPYPFYEDGYKLVESSHLGMEHQSATAYGNHYMNGYLGMDFPARGWGNGWDYIIVHESGHEWFGNNITSNDIADMWVHEGFTDYSETLFVECQYGKKAADEYTQGLRKNIENTMPGDRALRRQSGRKSGHVQQRQ